MDKEENKEERKAIKECPVCHELCFEDMDVCFGCLHRFSRDEKSLIEDDMVKKTSVHAEENLGKTKLSLPADKPYEKEPESKKDLNTSDVSSDSSEDGENEAITDKSPMEIFEEAENGKEQYSPVKSKSNYKIGENGLTVTVQINLAS